MAGKDGGKGDTALARSQGTGRQARLTQQPEAGRHRDPGLPRTDSAPLTALTYLHRPAQRAVLRGAFRADPRHPERTPAGVRLGHAEHHPSDEPDCRIRRGRRRGRHDRQLPDPWASTRKRSEYRFYRFIAVTPRPTAARMPGSGPPCDRSPRTACASHSGTRRCGRSAGLPGSGAGGAVCPLARWEGGRRRSADGDGAAGHGHRRPPRTVHRAVRPGPEHGLAAMASCASLAGSA